ncbi:MAG: hypothetical protein ACYC55_05820, partial [Candidatus Geothermincolia bacterium]
GKAGRLLSTAQAVLSEEMGLMAGTQTQLAMSVTTLDLIRTLQTNLGFFIELNNTLAGKLGQALEIMQKM